MINNKNLLLSVNKYLYENLTVPYNYKVIEASQIESVRDSLDNGEIVITYVLGTDLVHSMNHPKTRLNVNLIKLVGPSTIFDIDEALGRVVDALFPMTSFQILDFDNSEAYLSDLVIFEKSVQTWYTDGDRYLIRPVIFQVGYGNVFNN